MPKPRQQNIEVAIVGGGLVGALLALLLAREGRSVLIVEKKIVRDLIAEKKTETRTLGLNYGSVRLFEAWGLSDIIFKAGQPLNHIHVSDQNHSGIVHIDAKAESLPYLGYSIPFTTLLQDLQQRVLSHPGITCIEGIVSAIEYDDDSVSLAVGNVCYQADLLVGADGVNSIVRKTLGIAFGEYDYHETALIGPVEMSHIKAGWAFERFTEQGPVALLPNQSGLMTVVWVMPTSLAPMRMALPSSILCEDLQRIFSYRAGIFKGVQPWVAYPLKRVTSDNVYRGRVGLIGNAAHLLHPVSGQGFNLSVRDVLAFVEGVRKRAGAKLGPDLWKEYEDLSLGQQKMMVGVTHGLTKVFESSALPMRIARNAALHGVEHVGFMKTMLNDVMIGGI